MSDLDRKDAEAMLRCSSGDGTLVLNDMGGCIACSINLTATLRAQEHGHQPIVILRDSARKNQLKHEG